MRHRSATTGNRGSNCAAARLVAQGRRAKAGSRAEESGGAKEGRGDYPKEEGGGRAQGGRDSTDCGTARSCATKGRTSEAIVDLEGSEGFNEPYRSGCCRANSTEADHCVDRERGPAIFSIGKRCLRRSSQAKFEPIRFSPYQRRLANDNGEEWSQPSQISELRKSNFYAATYVNAERKEIVIAYRGSLFPGASVASLKDWATNIGARYLPADSKIRPTQYEAALEYAKSVQAVVQQREYKDFKIKLTGHSEGGGEASYVASQLGFDTYIQPRAKFILNRWRLRATGAPSERKLDQRFRW